LAVETSEETASSFLASIETAFEPLRDHPLSGASREQFFIMRRWNTRS
jgi:plasmid stabilization system protein ParE